MASPLLDSAQRYAAGALLALALRQAQIRQTLPLPSSSSSTDPDTSLGRCSSSSASIDGDGEAAAASHLWTHQSHYLLRPVLRFLDVDPKAWPALEETAASFQAKHHAVAYLRIVFEDAESSSERSEQELALTNAVDAMVMSLKVDAATDGIAEEKQHDNRHQGLENDQYNEMPSGVDITTKENGASEATNSEASFSFDESTLVDFHLSHQRKVTLLYLLLSACVADTPQDDKKSVIRKGYDARHRVALRLLAAWLDVSWIKMEAIEIIVACSAMAAAKEEKQSQEEAESTKGKWSKWKRRGIIGAAAVTGGALLAVTGGLAAPAIAAGFGALGSTVGVLVPVIGAGGFAVMATAAGSAVGSVAIAASFGAAGAGLTGKKMSRRIGDIKEFEFKPIGDNHNQGRLSVGISISGFAFEEEDFVRPWEGWNNNMERYILQWESENIIAMSTAIQDWLTSSLTKELMKRGAMMTVLSTLVSALAWPATLLSATNFIDSKWAIAIDRSDKAGKLLAEVLIKGLHGNRPVTLIGSSLGARVIFKCLQELAESKDNVEGLVERVILLGAPVAVRREPWDLARKMVAGRFVNVYSTNDWILGITFRASLVTDGLAGIQAIDVPGVENVDVTDLVDGHSAYLWATQQILEQIELDISCPLFSPVQIPNNKS